MTALACAMVTPSRRRAFTNMGASIVGAPRVAGIWGHRRECGHRQPEIRDETDVQRTAVIDRTDADDRHRHAFDPDDASEDSWVRAEPSGPRLVPEDGDERSPGPLLRLVEPAAERRPESQGVEIARRRVLDDRVADGAIVEIADGVRNTGGHRRRKDVGVLRDLHIGGVRSDDERPAVAAVLIDVDEAIGVGQRLFTEQHRVHEAEDRGVGADGEAEDQHRRRREPPIAHEPAEPLPRIAHERVPGAGPARIAAVLLDLLDGAEQASWLKARLVARQAAGLQALGLAFEMELQLFVQIRFAAAAENERSEPAADDVPGAHGYVRCNTRLTPADRRSHFATSASSCLRPALVSA